MLAQVDAGHAAGADLIEDLVATAEEEAARLAGEELTSLELAEQTVADEEAGELARLLRGVARARKVGRQRGRLEEAALVERIDKLFEFRRRHGTASVEEHQPCLPGTSRRMASVL